MMRRYRLHWAVFTALLAVAAGGQPLEPEALLEEPSGATGSYRVWIEPGSNDPGPRASIHARYAEEYLGGEDVVLECEVWAARDLGNTLAVMTVRNEALETIQFAEEPLTVTTRVTPFRFLIDTGSLAEGDYTVHVALRTYPDKVLAVRVLRLAKYSLQSVLNTVDAAAASIAQTRAHLDSLAQDGVDVARALLRTQIAEDCVAMARSASAKRNWRRTRFLANYVEDTANAAMASLVRGRTQDPRFDAPEAVETADVARLVCRDGAFYAGERPVFLFGGRVREDSPAGLAALRRYGLNFALVNIAPDVSGESNMMDPSSQARLDRLYDAARTANVAVSAMLAPQALTPAQRALCMERGIVGFGPTGEPTDIRRKMRAYIPYLAGQDMTQGIGLAVEPAFHLTGQAQVDGFAAYVRGRYRDTLALNQAWGTRLTDASEIVIDPDYMRAAYQYDWQTYHLDLGTDLMARLADAGHALAPETPLYVEFDDELFERGATRRGVDPDNVMQFMDLGAIGTSVGGDSQLYALDFPGPMPSYSLLRAFAPDKPLLEFKGRAIDETTPAQLRCMLWESAIAGLNGGAFCDTTGHDGAAALLDDPRLLETYAVANLDLNRLAPVIQAFQQAPATVAILWSPASRIYNDGKPYLASALRAYEGCSFSGHKVGFITEDQCIRGGLPDVCVLVIPDTPAVADSTFAALSDYARNEGAVIRQGAPMPYNENGQSRHEVMVNSAQTFLVRGVDTSTSYLHAMDAVQGQGHVPPVPHAMNRHNYPLEGVRTRTVRFEGDEYLYIVNLRKAAVQCHIDYPVVEGLDLIGGQRVSFPMRLERLEPMLIKLDRVTGETIIAEE